MHLQSSWRDTVTLKDVFSQHEMLYPALDIHVFSINMHCFTCLDLFCIVPNQLKHPHTNYLGLPKPSSCLPVCMSLDFCSTMASTIYLGMLLFYWGHSRFFPPLSTAALTASFLFLNQ